MVTETQPGREPEQGAGPENEIREQAEYGTGYADPSAHSSLGSREPTEAHEVVEGLREAGSTATPGA